MKERWQILTVVALIAVLLLSALLWVNYTIVPKLPAGDSFLVPWMAARTFLFEQSSPYGLEVAQKAQVAIYGRLATDNQYPYHLDIPFYVLFFYFPFALIDNFDLARALWMSFAEIALVGVGFLSIELTNWKPSRLHTSLFYLTLFLSFYGFYPLLEGSGALFTALILLLLLLALRADWDIGLGILLLFGTFQLQNGGVLFLLILFWIVITERWRAVSVSGMSVLVLLLISFLLLPDWLMPFFGSLFANWRVGQGFLFSDFLQIWRPVDGNLIAQIMRWVFLIILIVEWRAVRGKEFSHLVWVASLSLAVAPFLNIRISPLSYTAFFLPLTLVFKIAEDRWERPARWVISLILLLLLSAWGLFLRAENALQMLTFLFPAFLVFALYWLRWWLIRPPRTWLDEAEKFPK